MLSYTCITEYHLNEMIKTCRNILYICLAIFVSIQPLKAEENVSGQPQAVDPAMKAVEALSQQTTETGNKEAEAASPAEADTGTIPGQTDTGSMEESATVATDTTEAEAPSSTPPAENLPVAKDVILVLDNSGSMKKNDPQFLASQAVNEFINKLDEQSRVGIIIFDQSVRVAIPLTPVSDETREHILKSLDQINYKGQYTDSPAAMERAIYDLKNNGRTDAKKLIVFMTDGIVDTGNADKDLEKAKWLRQDLAADAADAGIQIFGIAFTEEADFQLIQSLSQQTDGEYYRALKPEDLDAVFKQVNEKINKVPEPEPVVAPEPVQPPEPKEVAPPPPPQPVIIEVPSKSTKMNEEEKLRSMMILVALAVLIIAVIIMVLMLIRGSRKKEDEDDYAQEAFLNDINNYTSQSTYKLGKKPTMLGRVAGTDTDHLNYIVIPQTTIGRRHALIEYKDFAYWIIDQGSINGTFVNDQIISSETRLKHGDRVRLHKFEFEFVMPEMVEAGMTVISKTVLANNPAAMTDEPTISRNSGDIDLDEIDLPEPEFDITGSDSGGVDPDEEDTIVRGTPPDANGEDEEDSSDETIMLDEDSETITPDDDDATIRPDVDDDEDLTVDDFVDNHKKK